ncbi:MAG: hypothetical protein CMH57_13520 [Myxococcales bacterium]|nr:hypothetical protein [Myxococcales bacterium]
MKVEEKEAAEQAPAPTRKKKKRKDPLIGETIANRYRIISRIGAGGMGVVYKGDQAAMDRKIAIKVLPRDLDDESLIERFRREARAASQLRHPNTITLYDFGLHEEILYIAMEFLDGISLNQAMKAGPMPAGRVINIVIQTLRSLAEAHKKGIVHRDIKPDNVFLIRLDGTPDFVKVLDFGVAKLTKSEDKTLTQAGMIFGTPKYMSPEQARSKPTGPRSDLYAVGIMAYEMLTGQVPFDADDHVSILLKHCTEPVPSFAEINPDVEVPEDLGQVIVRSLAKKPEDRFQDAEEMIQALEQLSTKYHYSASSIPAVGGDATPVPGAMSTGGVSPSTGSLPPMGRPSPSEVNLTPSGSVDWSGNLELDLGVTAVHHDPLAEADAQDQGKLLLAIGGGVGALLILLAVIFVLLSGDPDEPGGSQTTAQTSEAATTVVPDDKPDDKPETTAQEEPDEDTKEPDDEADGGDAIAATTGGETSDTETTQDSAPEVKEIEIKLTSEQPGVVAYDAEGKMLGTLPKTLTYETGEEAIQLTFKKKGFLPTTEDVVPSESKTLNVLLKRAPKRNGGNGQNTGGLKDPWK